LNIKAAATLDYKTLKRFYRFGFFRSGKIKTALILLFLLLVYALIISGYSELYSLAEYSIIAFILMLLIIVFKWLFMPKIIYRKSNAKLKDMKNEFVFSKESIHLESRAESYSGNAEIDYNIIQKVYETDTFFYLYINAHTAYAVDKSRIENGTALELKNLLDSVLPPKKLHLLK